MKVSLQQKVVLVFGGALLVLFVVAVDSFGNLKRVERSSQEVTHTYETYTALAEVIGHLRDIQAGKRGFVVTGDDSFLESYHGGVARLASDLEDVRLLVADDPEQSLRLDTLRALVRAKVDVSERVIQLRREQGFRTAARLMGEGPGRAVMESARETVARMKAHETRNLLAAEARQRDSVRNATLISVIGFLIAFLLGVVAMLAVRRDIGRREAAEARALELCDEAEAANRAKSDFLARMSHELRTPLNSIIGFSGILLKNRSGTLADRELSYLDRIQINGRHLLALINDVLDISRIEANRAEVHPEPVFVDALIRETLAQLDERAAGRDVVLRTELPSGVASIEADPAKLKQVLINLVGNALKFTQQGEVRVILDVHPASGVPRRIDVVDTGVGIPPHRLEAIFAAFEQADRSVTQRFGGTGLGLTISRALCTLMGYELHVRSEVGRGSIFSVLLDPAAALPPLPATPRGDAEHAVPAEPAEHPVTAGAFAPTSDAPRILVIDDEADSRTLLRHMLEEAGYRVLLAASAAEGLEMMRLHRPAAVTLDIVMPPGTGLDVFHGVRHDPALRGIPMIVVSIVPDEGRLWGGAAFEHLCKPVSRDRLIETIERAIATSRSGAPAPVRALRAAGIA